MPWLLRMTLLVTMLMVPAQLYLSFRYYATTKILSRHNTFPKTAIPILLISFYLYPLTALADFYITGSVSLLSFPKILTYWFWFGLIFLFQLATWVIIADLIKVTARFFYGDKNIVYRWHSRALLALIPIVFLFVAAKTYLHTTQVQAEHITLEAKDLSPSLEGFTIAHITDVQGDEYTSRHDIRNYIQQLNAQHPDLIIFTGDLISYGTDFISMSAEELGKAKAKYGTIAVVGDHDYWAGLENVEAAFAAQNISLLQDQNFSIQIDSATTITVTGVTEVYSRKSRPVVVDSLVTNTVGSSLKIFASHQVNDQLITSARQQNYHLMLAGHTHGGQIYVPFLGMSFSASERETKYVKGLYHEKGLPININNGLGFTLAPIRYEAPPNISVITFKHK